MSETENTQPEEPWTSPAAGLAAVNHGEPALDDNAVKAKLAAKTAPRVTEDTIKARIRAVDYLVHGTSTICVIQTVTGFKVFGHSTPASPDNFDPQIGEHYAYKNAFNQLWQLEGYLLRDSLAWQEAAAAADQTGEGNPNTVAQPRG